MNTHVDVQEIFAEDPTTEQWRLLSQYAYPRNVERYFEYRHHSPPDDTIVEHIAGCIRQAEVYFQVAQASPLDISPVLYYYGATNLLTGIGELVSGSLLKISHHGMAITTSEVIGDVSVRVVKPTEGGLHIFSNLFSPRPQVSGGESWTFTELVAGLPDLLAVHNSQYASSIPHSIPVERIQDSRVTFERVLMSDLNRYADPFDTLSRIDGFGASYLDRARKPQGSTSYCGPKCSPLASELTRSRV